MTEPPRKRGRPRKIQPGPPVFPAPAATPTDVPPGLLTAIMHWTWRRLDELEPGVHLVGPVYTKRSRTACSIPITAPTYLPDPLRLAFCAECKARNGGIT